MQRSEHPYLADWFAISLRWLTLLGIANALFIAQAYDQSLTIILLVCTLWNILSSILAVFNRRVPLHRPVNILIDIVAGLCFFFFSGGLSGPLSWISLLAIFSAGIYFEWFGGVLTGLLVSILQLMGILIAGKHNLTLEFAAILGGFNLVSGLIFGLLGSQLYRNISSEYKAKISRQKNKDKALVRGERERLHTLFSLIEALSETLNYESVLERALDLSQAVLEKTSKKKERIISAVLLFDENNLLQCGSSRGIPQAELRHAFPADEGILNNVIKNANPILLTLPKEDPELKRILSLHNCQSLLCLPLHRGLNSYGVMLFAHEDEGFFNEYRREFLEIISHQAVVAIQNARLFQEMEEDKQRIITSQEEARKELARELHDGPTQSVTGIAMRTDILKKMIKNDVPDLDIQHELDEIEKLARSTTKEMRAMLYNLRPLVLESEGLGNALAELAIKVNETYQQNVVVEVNKEIEQLLEPSKQTAIFQIVEEAVNNARKHAQAEKIEVSLRPIARFEDLALLEIKDNGIGFDLEAVSGSYDRRGSLGMINLQERVNLISGMLHIDTKPGSGTSIQTAIPLTQQAAERLRQGRQND